MPRNDIQYYYVPKNQNIGSGAKYSTKPSYTLNPYLYDIDHSTDRLVRGEKMPRREYISRSAGNIAAFDRAFKGAR